MIVGTALGLSDTDGIAVDGNKDGGEDIVGK